MTVLTCAELQAEVADDATDFFPPILQLAFQVFTLAPGFSGLSGAGFVYGGNYGGAAPTGITPAAGTSGIAIDSITRRQWQYYNSTWN